MPEFLKLEPPFEALKILLEKIKPLDRIESMGAESAVGRVTAQAYHAPYPLPSFRRSTVDGFAVQAGDTHGASESLPAYLNLAGEVPMGDAPDFAVEKQNCALIHTGGMLPEGADAVVMVEFTQQARPEEVEVLRAVAVGENLLEVGEDVKEGEAVIPSGVRLRPAEIGGLMALGYTEVKVAAKPRVGIISSGDEVVHPSEKIRPGQVRDINSYTLQALVENAGGEAVLYGIARDEYQAMYDVIGKAMAECDLVVVTAGSSASARDLTSIVINDLGEPGVLVHGVNVRPGKPTILGIVDQKPVIGLPGNPVSALVIAGLFVSPVIEKFMGVKVQWPKPRVPARLSLNLASQAGREDWVAVKLNETPEGFIAEPVFGKSNLIFTLARADGLIRIPPDANGLGANEQVDVWLI